MQSQPEKLGGSRDASRLSEKGYYPTDLSVPERQALLAAALELQRSHKQVRYLEIGILGGGTIKYLRDNTAHLQFTGIDLFELFSPSPDNTHLSGTYKKEDVQKALGEDVRLIMGDSSTVLPKLHESGEKYDLVFIDGNHTYSDVKKDLSLVLPLLLPGAWVGFHNCSTHLAPDPKYIVRDGGPWKVTQELRRDSRFFLEIEVERIRIFSFNAM